MTGANSGIGLATIRLIAEQGAFVTAIDREQNDIVHSKLIDPFVCDVTDHKRLKVCVDQTIAAHGRIDILANIAGIAFYERMTESTLEHWRQTQAVNVEAMYALAKLVVPHMIERKYGRIVNISSTQTIASEPMVGAYAASKGAIDAWTRTLAVDLAEHGILVNAVAPGCIHTAMSMVNGVDETESDLFKEWYVKQRKIPLARPGKAEEVADAIAFLCSGRCTYITGHTLVVDGGLTITF